VFFFGITLKGVKPAKPANFSPYQGEIERGSGLIPY